MNLVVLDPGYTHANSHHQTVNLELNTVFQENGGTVRVFAASDIERGCLVKSQAENMHVYGYFKTPCYPKNADSLDRKQHEILAQTFEKEIIQLFQTGLIRSDENLLIHTGYSFHILGFAKAIWALKELISSRVTLSMMYHPGAGFTDTTGERKTVWDQREFSRYKLSFGILEEASHRNGVNIVIAVPCRSYQRVYQQVWRSGEVEVHPAVGFRKLHTSPKRKSNQKPSVLLFLGGAKAEKGIVFAARLGAQAAISIPGVDFVFHFNTDFPGAGQFGPEVATLEAAGKKHNNVRVTHGNLDADEYDSLISSCDLVSILYDPEYYGFKTSGVVWDVIRSKSINYLVTENTWSELELTEMGLPHLVVKYGDIQSGVEVLRNFFHKYDEKPERAEYPVDADIDYLNLINGSFGDWLFRSIQDNQFGKIEDTITRSNTNFKKNKGRILVVRTNYRHFSHLSGPGGFIPYLRAQGYTVDQELVTLGSEYLNSLGAGQKDSFINLTNGYLGSFQPNSVDIETKIQKTLCNYDIVHFVDGEHSGLLTALFNLKHRVTTSTKIVATYHQPQSILNQIIANPVYLKGFDAIQVMSPCQFSFFEPHVNTHTLKLIPHGLAPELLFKSLPAHIVGAKAVTEIGGFESQVNDRKILLTVGNWLRDFKRLTETAELMKEQSDIVFVVVSKGLKLDISHLKNIILLNEGISDSQLHEMYLKATMLFLPLEDGAANNAILESMAHGLPIVTTELLSTHYYTKECALFCQPNPAAYRDGINQALDMLSNPKIRDEFTCTLQTRAKELVWKEVAEVMSRELYEPFLAG